MVFYGAGSANLGSAMLLRDEAGVPAEQIICTKLGGVAVLVVFLLVVFVFFCLGGYCFLRVLVSSFPCFFLFWSLMGLGGRFPCWKTGSSPVRWRIFLSALEKGDPHSVTIAWIRSFLGFWR